VNPEVAELQLRLVQGQLHPGAHSLYYLGPYSHGDVGLDHSSLD
jgi:hypothetical protein